MGETRRTPLLSLQLLPQTSLENLRELYADKLKLSVRNLQIVFTSLMSGYTGKNIAGMLSLQSSSVVKVTTAGGPDPWLFSAVREQE